MNSKYEHLNNLPIYQLNTVLINACEVGDIELVEHLLDCKDGPQRDIHNAIASASYYGQLEILKYIFSLEPIIKTLNMPSAWESAFRCGCATNHINIVRYLLTAPELSDYSNIQVADNIGIRLACADGQLDVIQYLLTSLELKEHADILNNVGFYWAYKNDHYHVIKYLIFDYQIEKNDYINKCLRDNPNSTVEEFFKIRDNFNQLNETISSDQKNITKKKNKL